METGDHPVPPTADQNKQRYGRMVQEFADALAKKGPVPAAGAAAAAVVAQAAALGLLAVRVSLSRPDAQRPDVLKIVASDLESIVKRSIALIDKDAEMVGRVIGSSKATSGRQAESYQMSGGDAALLNEAPIGTVSLAADALSVLTRALPFIHNNVIAEAGVAAALLQAGARSAALIVRVNDPDAALKQQQQLGAEIDRLFERIWLTVESRKAV